MTVDVAKESPFDSKVVLFDAGLGKRAKTLIGFDVRYARIRDRLNLLLGLHDLPAWSLKYHKTNLPICDLMNEQYPLVIFHGDVGTGKTVMAECIANRLIAEAGSASDESILFKLSTRVRGSGKVGEMGTLMTQAFHEVVKSAGKTRRAMLIIDEGDSLAAKRSQEHSHHEDKVGVNTLIQYVDDLRQYRGRILIFLCTNRLRTLDAALMRRAAIIELFERPNDEERSQLFRQDLEGLKLTPQHLAELIKMTGQSGPHAAPWSFSDIRTRLYPASLALAFPNAPLTVDHFLTAARQMAPSPVMEDL